MTTKFRHYHGTADDSAASLAERIRSQESSSYIRWGDGDIECIFGLGAGMTCDGEHYSESLGDRLRNAFYNMTSVTDSGINRALGGGASLREMLSATAADRTKIIRSFAPKMLVGDWFSCPDFGPNDSNRYEVQYNELCEFADVEWQHFEAPLLTRLSPQLLDFYRAIKEDGRCKAFVGPARLIGAVRMLGAHEHIIVPERSAADAIAETSAALIKSEAELILFAAGRGGRVAMYNAWAANSERTYVCCGSGLDPLFVGRTRGVQVPMAQAREYFRELL